MSTLVENVTKVKNAHAALKTSIEAKGVTVPAGTKLTGMPALVDQIQTGGGGAVEPTNTRAVFAYDGSSSIVVPKTLVVDMTAMTDLKCCFSSCNNLTSLTLPDGFGQKATNLNSCFRSCDNLTSLTLPNGFGQNATDLGWCFYSASMTSLVLPEGFGQNATDLSYCFASCNNLTSLTLPDGFGQKATNLLRCFNDNRALTSLTLPDGFGQKATDLEWCFSNCQSLQSIVLPDGFGQNSWSLQYCFHYCEMLTTITGNPRFMVDISFSMSDKLTHDSIMVVINGLQTVTSTHTLTLGSTNLNKLTQEEKQVAIDKGWTLA